MEILTPRAPWPHDRGARRWWSQAVAPGPILTLDRQRQANTGPLKASFFSGSSGIFPLRPNPARTSAGAPGAGAAEALYGAARMGGPDGSAAGVRIIVGKVDCRKWLWMDPSRRCPKR